MKEKLILVGGGGHCKACIDVIERENRFEITGIVDVPEKLNQNIMGYKIIANDEDLPSLVKDYQYFFITIGHIKTSLKRIELFSKLKEMKAYFPAIFSPLAYISKHSKIGEGSIVMHHALINAGAIIGNNCIINSKALIEHDAVINDHCHVSTSSIVNGGVVVESGTFIGSNATVRENIEIGENSIIGCGVRVVKNISPHTIIK